MKGNPEERALKMAEYIAESGATVRRCAQIFGVSKSTVHKDLRTRLRPQNPALYFAVQCVLETRPSAICAAGRPQKQSIRNKKAPGRRKPVGGIIIGAC